MIRLGGLAAPASDKLDTYVINLRKASLNAIQIEELSRHQSIVDLSLAGSTIEDSAMAALVKLKNLRRLDLSYTMITGKGVALLEDLSSLKHLSRFKSIVKLSLSHTEANDESMDHVAQLKHLQTLYLSKTLVTAKGISQLGCLPSLTELFLEETSIHGNDFSCVQDLRRLKVLWIAKSQTTRSALWHFEKHPTLEHISSVDEEDKTITNVWTRGIGSKGFERYWTKD